MRPEVASVAARSGSRRRLRLSPFLALLARDTQRRAWEGLQPTLTYRLTAVVAAAIRAEFDMPQREPGLIQHFPGVVGQRHFGIALEIRRTDIRRIPSGSLAPVTKQSDQLSGREFLLYCFTVADAYLYTALSWSVTTRVPLTPYPSIKKYCQRLRRRPSIAAAFQEELALYRVQLARHGDGARLTP